MHSNFTSTLMLLPCSYVTILSLDRKTYIMHLMSYTLKEKQNMQFNFFPFSSATISDWMSNPFDRVVCGDFAGKNHLKCFVVIF
jgi:hypothetical protein